MFSLIRSCRTLHTGALTIPKLKKTEVNFVLLFLPIDTEKYSGIHFGRLAFLNQDLYTAIRKHVLHFKTSNFSTYQVRFPKSDRPYCGRFQSGIKTIFWICLCYTFVFTLNTKLAIFGRLRQLFKFLRQIVL